MRLAPGKDSEEMTLVGVITFKMNNDEKENENHGTEAGSHR